MVKMNITPLALCRLITSSKMCANVLQPCEGGDFNHKNLIEE
jgi:hypothetical protein